MDSVLGVMAELERRRREKAPLRRLFRVILVVLGGAVMALDAMGTTGFSPGTLAPGQGGQIALGFLLVACLLLALQSNSMLCGSLHDDREQQVLGVLMLSDLGTLNLLRYKALRRLFVEVEVLAVTIPFWIYAAARPGVAWWQPVLGLLTVLAAWWVGASVMLLAAALGGSRKASGYWAAFLGCVLLVVPPLSGWVMYLVDGRTGPGLVIAAVVSPYMAAWQVFHQGAAWTAFANLVLMAALGEGLQRLAGRALGRHSQHESLQTSQQAGNTGATGKPRRKSRRWSRKPKPAIGDRCPVYWQDRYFGEAYVGSWVIWGSLVVVAAGLSTAALVDYARRGAYEAGVSLIVPAISLLLAAAAGVLMPLSYAAAAFRRERLNRSLELLLLTDLHDREIVDGKLRALVERSAPWWGGAVLATLAGLLWIGWHQPVVAAVIFLLLAALSVYLWALVPINLARGLYDEDAPGVDSSLLGLPLVIGLVLGVLLMLGGTAVSGAIALYGDVDWPMAAVVVGSGLAQAIWQVYALVLALHVARNALPNLREKLRELALPVLEGQTDRLAWRRALAPWVPWKLVVGRGKNPVPDARRQRDDKQH